jgi:hypothetical protein
LEIERMVAETNMYVEREEIGRPDYYPLFPDLQKWATRGGKSYRRLSENSFVARASENFSGKAARPKAP